MIVKARGRDTGTGTTGYDDMPGHLLRRCQQIAVSIFLQECKDWDLTQLQFVVLGALNDHGALDQTAPAGLTALDRTTIGVVVGKQIERGLVARRRSDSDRRANVITCTEAGRVLLAEADARIERLAEAENRFAAGVETDFLALSDRADDMSARVANALSTRREVIARALERGLRQEMAQTQQYLLTARIAIARATDRLAANTDATTADAAGGDS